jgi:hypothetical protein
VVEDLFRRLAVELGEAAPIAPLGSRFVSRPGL